MIYHTVMGNLESKIWVLCRDYIQRQGFSEGFISTIKLLALRKMSKKFMSFAKLRFKITATLVILLILKFLMDFNAKYQILQTLIILPCPLEK